jgi:hypothetical protein
MDGDPIQRAIRVVFVKERGCIVGVENVAESSRVFGEVALRVGMEFTECDFSDQLRVLIARIRSVKEPWSGEKCSAAARR